jgi:hypothetical protein
VPNTPWFQSICNGSSSKDVGYGASIQRGSGSFVRDPQQPVSRWACNLHLGFFLLFLADI